MQTSPAKLSSPRSAPDLDQLLRDLDESSLSIAEVSRRRKVPAWHLYNAKRAARRTARPERTAFVPVTVKDPAVEPLELVLSSGVRLRIPRDFDEALLRRVLGVLASC